MEQSEENSDTLENLLEFLAKGGDQDEGYIKPESKEPFFTRVRKLAVTTKRRGLQNIVNDIKLFYKNNERLHCDAIKKEPGALALYSNRDDEEPVVILKVTSFLAPKRKRKIGWYLLEINYC